MSERLPADLIERLGHILGDELPAFVAAHADPPVRGLRLNPRKVTSERLGEILGVPLVPVPWAPTGFWLPSDTAIRLGDSLAHRAGLFYLQEPSAMSPAEVLAHGLGADLEGAHVIDLAAAPGGKTTRLTDLVGRDGLVVANEIERKRLGTLHENLDRWGADNVVTTSRPLDVLADALPGAFDAVLLDAPCTGEGMFRRDPEAVRQWSPAAVRGAARRQAALLAAAERLVAPGGVLVYSTCTFAPEENEQQLVDLVADRPEWSIEDARYQESLSPGIALPGADLPTERSVRLWPHRHAGEGHFASLLRLDPAASRPAATAAPDHRATSRRDQGRSRREGRSGEEVVRAWERFRADHLPGWAEGRGARDLIEVRGDQAFLRPRAEHSVPPELLVRPGVPLGRSRPGRFEPSQALAGLLDTPDVGESTTWSPGDARWDAFLRGEEVRSPGPDGWVEICAYGWGVGWARRRGGVLKNFLPARLRSRR